MQFWYLQLAGALYLLYLPTKHFWPKRKASGGAKQRKPLGFWPTVALVEFTDLVFAIDSVLVAVSVSNELWVIYTGAISGVVLLRFAAFILTKVLDRMPGLEHMAYILVGWVAVKLLFLSVHTLSENYSLHWPVSEMNKWVFWTVTALIIVVGTIWSKRAGVAGGHHASELEGPKDES
jgi:YkoY family integral membrane protein